MQNELTLYSQILKAYECREETLEGKSYLAVPVTMIVEGVMAGSRGPMLQLAKEFGKVPQAWNGVPVTIQHPQQDGNFISANSPEILTNWAVGKVFNTSLEGNKLKSEAWLEIDKLKLISEDTLTAIQSGAILEVSVGSFTDEEDTTGDFNGIQYNAIARNHRPDHLALLPGGTGACSVKDGCGIRVNSNNEQKGVTNVEVLTAIQVLRESGIQPQTITDNSEMGLKEKMEDLQNLVRSLNPIQTGNAIHQDNYEYNYLVEAYDGYLIYEFETGGEGKAHEGKYYKRNYQFNVKDGKAEFTSEPQEVEKKVEYKAIPTTNSLVRTKFNINKEKGMENKCTPCVKAKAEKLITANMFCEDDRVYLEGLEEARLDKFLETTAAPVVNTQVTKESALNALKGSLNAEEFMSLAPVELQEQMKTGLALHQSQKSALVAGILANTETVWNEDELKAMPFETLQKVHASSTNKKIEDGFAFFGLGNNAYKPAEKVSEIAPMLPTGVTA